MWQKVLPVLAMWFTREPEKAVIDDIPFQLQYVWTTAFLFISSTLVSLSELIGNPYNLVKTNSKFMLLS